jgi:hypothetical protein
LLLSGRDAEGKLKIRNNEVIRSKNETIEIRNHYLALATDDGKHESENKTNICENLSSITTSLPETNTKHNKQECMKTVSPQKEPRRSEETRHNLQSKSMTPRKYNAKGNKRNIYSSHNNKRTDTMEDLNHDFSPKDNTIMGKET